MPVIPIVTAATAVYGTVKGARDSKKALAAQQQAQQQSDATLAGLDERTAAMSEANARRSADLERQLTPEVPQLRTEANQALLGGLRSGTYGMSRARGMLNDRMGSQVQTPLLSAAIAKAQADLALGGKLPLDVQNAATRRALATAGTVGGGLGLGRDLVARDLGLNSLQLEQQRLQNASELGGQELQAGQFNAENLLNQINLLNAVNSGEFGRNLDTARFAESIQRPIVGIDPGSYANLQMANANAQGAQAANIANIKGQQSQNYLNAAGQIGGALLAFNNARSTTPMTRPGAAPRPTYTVPTMSSGGTYNPTVGSRQPFSFTQ